MQKTAYTIINESSIAAGASTTLADCTALSLARAITLYLQAEATFDASATGGLTIKYYTSNDNTNWDTVEWLTDTVAVSPGNTVRVPFNPISTAPLYLKALVENLDSTYAVTNVRIIATLTEV